MKSVICFMPCIFKLLINVEYMFVIQSICFGQTHKHIRTGKQREGGGEWEICKLQQIEAHNLPSSLTFSVVIAILLYSNEWMNVCSCVHVKARARTFATRWDFTASRCCSICPHWCKCEKFLGRFCVHITCRLHIQSMLVSIWFWSINRTTTHFKRNQVKCDKCYVFGCAKWTWHGIISLKLLPNLSLTSLLFLCFPFDLFEYDIYKVGTHKFQSLFKVSEFLFYIYTIYTQHFAIFSSLNQMCDCGMIWCTYICVLCPCSWP